MADVKKFGAKGDGQTDDTAAIQRAVDGGDGLVLFPRGSYVISKPIEASLGNCGRIGIVGAQGCATVVMAGSGPAFNIVGTHEGTADPKSIASEVANDQRMPTVTAIEIVGAHPEADGLRLEGLWQPTLSRVSVRNCRHGIHAVRRLRNLIVAECHVYDCRGVGVFYDHLNLHQSNITGCHISYNKRGGIKVLESEIRNLQIVGNDIEYNYDPSADESADVWIETLSSSIREGTIVGNTIQAVCSPGGANVRFRGQSDDVRHKAGLWTISGNLISSQAVNIHLQYARGIAISGNAFFSGHEHAFRFEQSEHVVVGPNVFDHNPDYRVDTGGGVLFDGCTACAMTGSVLAAPRGFGDLAKAAIEVRGSTDVCIADCQILDPEPRGIYLKDSARCRISSCTIADRRCPTVMREAIRIRGGKNNMLVHNILGLGTDGSMSCDEAAAALDGNIVES